MLEGIGGRLGEEVCFGGLGEDDFFAVGKDDAFEAHVSEALGGCLYFIWGFAGAEVGVECFFEEEMEDRVAVWVQEG